MSTTVPEWGDYQPDLLKAKDKTKKVTELRRKIEAMLGDWRK